MTRRIVAAVGALLALAVVGLLVHEATETHDEGYRVGDGAPGWAATVVAVVVVVCLVGMVAAIVGGAIDERAHRRAMREDVR